MDSQPESLIQALRLAAIVEGSDDAIVSKNVDGIIMSWNAAAERMFGYQAEEVMGSPSVSSSRRIVSPKRTSSSAAYGWASRSNTSRLCAAGEMASASTSRLRSRPSVRRTVASSEPPRSRVTSPIASAPSVLLPRLAPGRRICGAA